jgi:L-carnitine CoA-transferase
MKRSEIPEFGNMHGVRVISAGNSIAGPVACSLFAEQGADVIQIESTKAKDMIRSIGDIWTVEHRNNRTIALNIRSAEGEKIFRQLVRESDILIEGSKGGTWDNWGLSDEVLWEVNPRLVIAHVSGYGQTGLPEYVSRASYDPIGQAFSASWRSGRASPTPRCPSCLHLAISPLSSPPGGAVALLKARETGKGERIDVAQYEVMVRIQADYLMNGLNYGKQAPRMGIYGNAVVALPNVQICGDGNYVMTAIGGVANFKKIEKLFGLENDPDFAEPHAVINKDDGPRAVKIVDAMNTFCMARTAEQVNDEFNALQLPCSVIMTYGMMAEHPHYQARGTFTTWFDPIKNREIKGVNTIPFFKNNPSQIYRGGPVYGMDNEDILTELGYTDEEIAKLYEQEIVKK